MAVKEARAVLAAGLVKPDQLRAAHLKFPDSLLRLVQDQEAARQTFMNVAGGDPQDRRTVSLNL